MNEIKAIQKGYYFQIKRYEQEKGETLYLRPNKIYQIGNSKEYSIEIGNDHIGQIECNENGRIIITKDSLSGDQILVNGENISQHINGCLLSHKDVITISNIHFIFYSYFHNPQINIKSTELHQFLLSNYKILYNELSLIQRDSFNSFNKYKYALTSLWKSIENQSEEKQNECIKMFESILTILHDDNPLGKLQIEKMKVHQLYLKKEKENNYLIPNDNKEGNEEIENRKRNQFENENNYDSKRTVIEITHNLNNL